MSKRMAWESGTSAAPERPCNSRNRTISGRLVAIPHKAEATVKPTIEIRKTFLRPKRPASQPVSGIMIADAMM